MDPTRGNRKVLPNYLLDDFAPPTDSKASSDTSVHHSSSSQSSHQLFDHGVGAPNESANTGDVSDTSTGQFGVLPRRKKKLRQACVYCRRSHLVCEEKRPCHRCVKRGIADRCVDPPQEGQQIQDNGWSGTTENASAASSSRETYISPTPAAGPSTNIASSSSSAPSDSVEAGIGQKKKRKTRPNVTRASSTGPRPQIPWEGSHPDVNSSREASESANAEMPFPQTPNRGHPLVDVDDRIPGSSTLHGMPGQSAASYPSLSAPMPMQAGPATAARSAPSQLLQVQPIFQPPSSAELDSLFSTYFFDVADAFNRPNGAYPPGMSPAHPPGHDHSLFPPHQAHLPPDAHRHGILQQTDSHATHGSRAGNALPLGANSDSLQPAQRALALQQQQPRPFISAGVDHFSSHAPRSGGANPEFQESAVPLTTTRTIDGAPRQTNQFAETMDGKDSLLRQKPGDVYAPYPYRKGYASLMRYMTEQNWSEQSIRSVEAALSKIRRLWFSLEDNIQPSSMIQLQAEWAGNVRYYSESVISFAPVPMLVCRKAGEVYASNQLAQELCGRSREQMTRGRISVYELMTEASASMFFRLYELAVGGTQAEDGSYVPSVGKTAPLYWNAEIVQACGIGSSTVIPTRGIFEMKIAPCGLPSLLVCCFVPLS